MCHYYNYNIFFKKNKSGSIDFLIFYIILFKK